MAKARIMSNYFKNYIALYSILLFTLTVVAMPLLEAHFRGSFREGRKKPSLLTKLNDMADFTMCKGEGCPVKWKMDCSRFRAVPAKVQSYMKAPFDHKEGYCEFYDQAI